MEMSVRRHICNRIEHGRQYFVLVHIGLQIFMVPLCMQSVSYFVVQTRETH